MRCFKDLAIVTVWTVALLIIFEIGLRASGTKYEGSFYQPDPVRYVAFRPKASGWILEGENFFTVNSLGMADSEHAVVKPADTIRIALVGDSITAAQQVPLQNTMAK